MVPVFIWKIEKVDDIYHNFFQAQREHEYPEDRVPETTAWLSVTIFWFAQQYLKIWLAFWIFIFLNILILGAFCYQLKRILKKQDMK